MLDQTKRNKEERIKIRIAKKETILRGIIDGMENLLLPSTIHQDMTIRSSVEPKKLNLIWFTKELGREFEVTNYGTYLVHK